MSMIPVRCLLSLLWTNGPTRWDKISEISTNTHRYLNDVNTSRVIQSAATKIGKIELTKRRFEGQEWHSLQQPNSLGKGLPTPPSHPDAVELPGGERDDTSTSPYLSHPSSAYPPYPVQDTRISSQDKFALLPHSPDDIGAPRVSAEMPAHGRRSGEHKYRSPSSHSASPRRSGESQGHPDGPPLPPKTPMNEGNVGSMPPSLWRLGTNNPSLPYPDFDGPPPVVNKLRKPQFNPG